MGAIGVFDSGSGGLSVLKAMRTRVPEVDVVYFGDIKHVPYGTRAEDDLLDLTIHGLRTLRMFGAQEIVNTCNAVDPKALQRDAEGAKVMEMSRPVTHALREYAGGRILLLGTPATVASRIFETAFGSMVVLEQLAIPDLEAAIEFGSHGDSVQAIIRKALAQKWGQAYDYIFLGCAHFPLVRACIEEEARAVFGSIGVIDPADIVADEMARHFTMEGSGSTYFKLSKDSEHFRRRVGELFPKSHQDFTII
ncbi:MAG: aspartate/glutamate racemase family protein [Minisyncoccia bacterium]